MIRNIIETILLVSVFIYMNLNIKIDDVKHKLDILYFDVESNGLNCIVEDKLYLVFDYDYISTISKKIFDIYKINIVKNNEFSFSIEVVIDVLFIDKVIKETYEIKKGDIYESFN